LIRIVRAQPGHFHPDDVAGAQAEIERRRLTPLLEKLAARDAERETPLIEKAWEIPWHIVAAAFFTLLLKDTFKHWLEYKLAYAVAFVLAWISSYWLIPRHQRSFSFRKWALVYFCGGLVVYLGLLLMTYCWPSASPAS
jgi:hypothetical protein